MSIEYFPKFYEQTSRGDEEVYLLNFVPKNHKPGAPAKFVIEPDQEFARKAVCKELKVKIEVDLK